VDECASSNGDRSHFLCDAINDPWKRVRAENNEFGVRSCNITAWEFRFE